MIKPSIGRVVWFQPSHPEGAPERDQPYAALIAYVHGDTFINIGGFDPNGNHFNARSVLLLQDDDLPPATGYYAMWMPFQKGQAKAQEAEKDRAEPNALRLGAAARAAGPSEAY